MFCIVAFNQKWTECKNFVLLHLDTDIVKMKNYKCNISLFDAVFSSFQMKTSSVLWHTTRNKVYPMPWIFLVVYFFIN